jgi:hypothetical protein
MRVALVVALVVSGCGDDDCTIGDAVDEFIDQASVMTSCGAHYADYPPTDLTEWRLAHDCVVTAVAAQTSFSVAWSRLLLEGSAQAQYVGLYVDGTLQIRRFSRVEIVGSPATLKTISCSTLADGGDCSTLVEDLCLACVDAAELDLCRSD